MMKSRTPPYDCLIKNIPEHEKNETNTNTKPITTDGKTIESVCVCMLSKYGIAMTCNTNRFAACKFKSLLRWEKYSQKLEK